MQFDVVGIFFAAYDLRLLRTLYKSSEDAQYYMKHKPSMPYPESTLFAIRS